MGSDDRQTGAARLFGHSTGASARRAYLVAVAAWLVALGVRTGIDAVFGSNPFFTPFYPAVLLAAWYGGLGPGLLAVALSIPSGGYLWMLDVSAIAPHRLLYVAGAAATMLMVVVMAELLRRERGRAEEGRRESERQAAALAEEARRREEFLAVLAHELRNPLNPLRNAARLLESGMSEQRTAMLRELIARQTGHLARLLDDLLDVSRTLRGGVTLRREPVDLCGVIAEAVEIAGEQAEQADLDLRVELASGELVVDGDRVRLLQAFCNLLDNAIKYSPPGGAIHVTAGRSGDRAVIAIRDQGEGVPAELGDRIFDPFVQGDETLARSRGGLGLGLYLVRQILEAHGGSVEARRGETNGTSGAELVVELTLSSRAAAAEAAAGSEPDAGRAGNGGADDADGAVKVLIVDDHRDSATSLSMLLEAFGHEHHVEHDAMSAMRAFGSFEPDVVIADIGLPDRDGYYLARQFRERSDSDDLLLVALTGYGDPEARRRSRESGFDVHLVKPVDPDELRRLLELGREALTDQRKWTDPTGSQAR